jgi:fructoselysine 6-kinase
MSKQRVATIGDNCIDQYAAIGKSAVGGNALNVAVHLSRLGWNSSYFGAVGDDYEGQRTRKTLQNNKVDVSSLSVPEGITPYTTLDVDVDGERIITYEDFGVCEHYFPSDADFERLADQEHIHLGWQKNSLNLRQRLTAANVSFSQDVAVNPEDGGLDIAFDSVGPSLDIAQQRIDELLRRGNKLAVVTCGPLGSMASDGTTTVSTGINKVDVVDTTGAGDTFIAGFVSAWLKGGSMAECLDMGRDCAAITCQHLGGFDQAYEIYKRP